MTRTLLVDADIVAFKFAAATEEVYYFDGGETDPSVRAEFEEAREGTERYLEELRVKLGADKIVICLTDPDRNFRKDIWPAYKMNRAGARKPTYLMQVKEWFKEKYTTYQRPALEADDCMGILGTHPTLVKGEKVIVSEDKDMQGVGPSTLFNPARDYDAKGNPTPRRISKLAADRYHLWQTIVGDTSDGYPGAVGVGPQSPEAQGVLLAKTVEEAWSLVLQAFARAKKPADPLVMARLARILRAGDWDFREKRPRLWTPPASKGHL